MTIRFAAAMNGTMPAIAGVLCTGAPLGAANDNPSLSAVPAFAPGIPRAKLRPVDAAPRIGAVPQIEIDAGIADALMHFARHGLSAAEQARAEAEAAHARGDVTARTRWLGICSHLDRRMAAALAKRLAG